MNDERTHRAMIRSVTVFLSSAKKVDRQFYDAATALGAAIARQGWKLVYGGNYIGCMAALADGARAQGGEVLGITPKLFVDKNLADTLCDELIVTESMRERKALLETRSDAFVCFPGGLGTLEEFFEIVVGRQLHYHHKPIVLLNLNGFYDPLLELFEQGVKQHFIRRETLKMIQVGNTIDDVVTLLGGSQAPGTVPPQTPST